MRWKIVQEYDIFIRRTVFVEADTEEAAENALMKGNWLDSGNEILSTSETSYESIENIVS